jgi:copper chaperone CopZ
MPPGHQGHPAQGAKTKQVTIAVSGMSCNACAVKVQKALAALPWVRHVHVDLAKEQAMITVDAARYDERALLKAIKEAGYGGRVMK